MYTIYRITDGRFSYIGPRRCVRKRSLVTLLNCISIYEHDRKTLG